MQKSTGSTVMHEFNRFWMTVAHLQTILLKVYAAPNFCWLFF